MHRKYATSLSFLPTHHCSGTSYKRIQNTYSLEVTELPILLGPLCLSLFFLYTSSSLRKGKARIEEPDSQHAQGHYTACQANTGFSACAGAAWSRSIHRFWALSPPGGAALSQSPATGSTGRIVLYSTAVSQPSSAAQRAVLTEQRSPAGSRRPSAAASPAKPLQRASSGLPFLDHALHWCPTCCPACFQVQRSSGEVMSCLWGACCRWCACVCVCARALAGWLSISSIKANSTIGEDHTAQDPNCQKSNLTTCLLPHLGQVALYISVSLSIKWGWWYLSLLCLQSI